jgi:drug/metabolite transporter (DMT)-like permease
VKTTIDLWAGCALVVMCASWGLNQVAIKVALSGFPAAFQMGSRSLVAALIVFVWCVFRQIPLFRSDGSLKAGLAVGLLFGVEFAVLFWGLQFTSASRAVIFLYTAPFIVASARILHLGSR